MVEFRTLGTISIRGPDGHELDSLLVQPKRLALLAYLCLATPRGFHRRDTLLGLFWPESDEAHARGALRKALHVLRRELGAGVVLTRGEDDVGVDFAAAWCDAAALGDHAGAGRLDEAVALYRGDLLPGFYVGDAPAFEHWLERERSRVRGLAARTANRLAERLQGEGKHADAIAIARTAVSLAGTDERLLRHLIELLDEAGDRTGAISAYDAFVREVGADAAVEPSAETQALIKRVRARSVVRVSQRDVSPAIRDRDAATHVPVPAPAPTRQEEGATEVVVPDEASTPRAVPVVVPRRTSLQFRVAAILILAIVVGGSVVALDARFRRPVFTETKRQITHAGNVLAGAISPDGQFVAYSVARGDSEAVVIQDVGAGGAPDTVFELSRALTLQWSPNGTQLLVGGMRGAVIIPRAGGTVRHVRVPAIPRPAVRAYWLPSGKHISMHVPTHPRVYVVDLATEDTVRSILVDRPNGFLATAGWEPNGEAFVISIGSRTSDSSSLVLSIHGRLELLVADNVRLSSPQWSPNGDTLFYIRDDRALWRIPLGSRSHRPSGPPELVSDQLDLIGPLDIAPTITATRDGRVAYLKGNQFSNLWLVERGPSGSLKRRLTDGTLLRWGTAVSPDGKWLAFAQETPDGVDLFRVSLSGGTPERLTFGARVKRMSDVAWSRDGNELAFVASDSDRFHVAIARRDGGRVRLLKRTLADKRQGHLAWAPGERIVYQAHDRNAMRVVDPVTGDVQSLVTDTGGLFASPRYSPDGNYLALRVRQSVAVWDLRKSALTTIARLEHWPRSWSEDGRYIYSQDVRSIHRLDSRREQHPQRVMELPWRNAQCSAAGVQHPNAFVCTTFEYVSDIWTTERQPRAFSKSRQ